MSAKYLLRFDDVCPTMNWQIWSEIEKILMELAVKPILAVVADNQDESLQAAPAYPRFWSEVRRWQKSGWTIGLHGYQHRYVTREAGLVGLNQRSEFAGLTFDEQEDKLQRAVEIFQREGVTPEVWVAPAHSFDETTISALKKIGVYCISDGYFIFPHRDAHGMLWIPQQLWRLRFMPFGVWTVCHHHNAWKPDDVLKFRCAVQSYREAIVSFDEIAKAYDTRQPNRIDNLVASFFRAALRLKRQVS